ncbi:MAG: 50S ribosomal protein L3 [Candidatus Aenigmarchaeota archaeon]|nr:50S ribosomal protein L3 [Candidatus Aenigmarchaeota archaeon]
MPSKHKPRRGSLQYWPRKRAKRIYPRTRFWPGRIDASGVKAHAKGPSSALGFAAWKVGMTHIQYTNNQKTPTYGKTVFMPVTILDAPSLFVLASRFYKTSITASSVIADKWAPNISKELKKHVEKLKTKKDVTPSDFDYITLIAATQPHKSGMNKEKPDIFEIGIGGKPEEQKTYAESVLGKEIPITDIFKPGEYINVSAVTKGHGFTGTVKRFGIRIHNRKEKQMQRHVGSIGSVTPRKVDWRVPFPGQYGLFTRTETNKRIVMIDDDPKKVTPKGGFMHYGNIKNYVVIEGSVPGPAKRLVRLRKSAKLIPAVPVEPTYISIESKQGV